MPTLLPRLHFDDSNKPAEPKLGQALLWQCSDCDRLFWLDRMTSRATVTQLRRVDAEFRNHCKAEHAGKAVVGLEIPDDEDVIQAAARIVREATEGK